MLGEFLCFFPKKGGLLLKAFFVGTSVVLHNSIKGIREQSQSVSVHLLNYFFYFKIVVRVCVRPRLLDFEFGLTD